MKRICIFVLAGLLGACQPTATRAPATAGGADTTSAAEIDPTSWVLPGAFSEDTTRGDLEARFGAPHITRVEHRDDDAVSRHLVLFAHDPSRRATVRFHDDVEMVQLAAIEVRDADSRWRGKHGVRIGMSLAELRRLNGKPFYLSGFDDAGRGYVRDQWSPALDEADNLLGRFDVAEGDRLYFGVELALRPGVDARAWPRGDFILSDDPRWPGLGEAVVVTAFSAWSSLDDEWE